MDAISYAHMRNNFAKTMKRVCSNHAPVIITHKNAKSVVMMSLHDYNAMMETVYLLNSIKNAAALAKSIQELENKNFRSNLGAVELR